MRARSLAVPVVAAALAAAGCVSSRPALARPDVILIVVDTLRADHLGTYGYDRPTSPTIDHLAARATTFDHAWAAAPWTLPSVMSIMTGRYPSSHRVENDGLRLADDVPTLAEILRASGYSTGAFISHIYVDRPFGFDRGFEVFDDFGLSRPDYRPEARLEPTADQVTGHALDWLGRQGAAPVFLFLHYFDPHWPYEPPGAYRALFPDSYAGPWGADYDSISRFQDPGRSLPQEYRRFLIDRYDGEIRFVDDQVARLLRGWSEARRARKGWVIVTADHGEEFKDHASMGHGRQLYEEVVHVPLIIAPPEEGAPGGAARDGGGLRVPTPVGTVDLLPTIATLAGAPIPPGVQGRSLAPFLGRPGPPAGSPADDRPLVSETIRLNAYRKAVRQGSLKLIRGLEENRTELYDLDADPQERRDLAADRPVETRRLLQALFSQVDLLSGSWNLRWSSDARPRTFQGQIGTTGIFRSVVPLYPGQGILRIERGNLLVFSDSGRRGESGLAFTLAPPDAPLTFNLLIDGRARIEKVFLGGRSIAPPGMPFHLRGDARGADPFTRPAHAEGRDLGFFIWRNRPSAPGESITLDDEIRERLRSLGYLN